jgi:3-oxoacyl-[acyl-carrier protein] reductase
MSRWATSYWREKSKEQGGPVYARIINTASEAFLVGSPAQPNYAAAKGGITAMTLSVAQSCARYGVRANVICPRARTRMTEVLGSMYAKPEEGFDAFAPENVAALVGFLASPAAEQVSGQVFIVYGGTVSLLAGPHRERDFQAEGRWTAVGLVDTLGGHFESRQPLAGYVMPYQ